MAKQTFTTGQVLTAAQMTSLQDTAMGGGNTTAKTASYVLVAADAGTVVAMDAVGATTITVNTALFAAGDTVTIQNRGAGVCTVTAGTATVVTAGSLALAQNEGGILYFTATGDAVFYDYVQSGPGTWTTYTPTNTGITVGNGTQTARYVKNGKTVTVSYSFTLGSTSSVAAGNVEIGLPSTANSFAAGVGYAYDLGIRTFQILAAVDGAGTTKALLRPYKADVTFTLYDSDLTAAMTFGNGDSIRFSITYEEQ
jgi:hypothetical protein